MSGETNCALLLAAGSGTRMQGTVDDKVLVELNGKPVFRYSFEAFAACADITHICIVYRDEPQRSALEPLTQSRDDLEVLWAPGGGERQESVLNGLEALPESATHTLIHDCARPLVSTESIQKLIETTRRDGAACLAHRVTDTIKRIPQAGETALTELEDLDRKRLWAMETPQSFRHADILKAYRSVESEEATVTDDTAAAAHVGIKATLVANKAPNPKITTVADLDYINWLLSK